MKAENIITRCLLLLGLACVAPLGSASPKWECSGHAADVETYDFAEIVIHVTDPDVANPFTDASVQGQFAHEGSEPVKVDGLCDATDGSEVRIRFMPSRLGRHAYSVTTDYLPSAEVLLCAYCRWRDAFADSRGQPGGPRTS